MKLLLEKLLKLKAKISFHRKWVVWLCAALISSIVYSNPVPINSSQGVTIQQSPTTTTINQTTQKGIINWQSFNIGQSEATHFNQPAGGVTLNRINPSQGPSSIYGVLTATGQIILVNPAGLYFGPSAYVNVGGLIATTANITDQNFLNSRMNGLDIYHFSQVPGFSGSIVNEGQIIAASHGLVALIGSNISNSGMIQANLGHVVLGSGGAFTLSFAGNDLISFSIDAKSATQGNITNTGMLQADGGSILVSANAAQNVLDNVINMQGVLQARSVGTRNGEIIISSGNDAGIVRVAAKINASGKGRGQKGGNVTITGYDISLESPTTIDVSGDSGGGNINIGGSAHGAGPLPNSSYTTVGTNVSLNASALTNGNGGNVVIWSNLGTKFYGSIFAEGGSQSGNGGWVETSGKNYLDVNGGFVNLLAPYGTTGTWLLDPTNIYIALNQTNATAAGMSGTDTSANTGSGGDPNTFAASGAVQDSLLTTGNLTNALGTANVVVTTTNASGTGVGNITVVDPITWSSANTLSLTAANNIVINAAITGTSGTLQLTAANAANSITTGSGGTINVKNFNLLQGQWTQISNPLPSFTVSNNFQINSGTLPSTSAQFIRALSGSGTSGSPYVIADVYGLQGMASTASTLADYYTLNNNIDATSTQNWNSGAGFVPIGTNASPFTGNLNGNNFAVQNLFINLPSTDYVGLFGSVHSNGSGNTISNIGVTNANVTGNNYVGSLIGDDQVDVTQAYSSGSVTGAVVVGGLMGQTTGNISYSYSSANATDTAGAVGGLVGELITPGTISYSFATGSVSTGLTTGEQAGGLVGTNSGTISNTYSTGPVTGDFNVGGLVGINTGPVNNSFSIGLVTFNLAGGGAGFIGNNGSVTNNNNFFDTNTSGQTLGMTSGGGITQGCFYGGANCTNGTTAATLSTASTFTNQGWTFGAGSWGIIEGQSYPYLTGIFTSTPRAVMVNTPASGGSKVTVAANGTVVDNGYTGANGVAYMLEKNGTIPDNAATLAYLNGGSTLGSTVVFAPSSGGSLSGTSSSLTLTSNTLEIGQSNTNSTFSNNTLSTAIGSLTDADILYTASGNNITSNYAFNVASPNSFSLTGNITTNSTDMTFGNLTINTSSPTLTGNNGNIYITGSLNGNGNTLNTSTINTVASTISGQISNLTALNVSGNGGLALTGSNTTYSGTTTVTTNDQLFVGNDHALGTNTATVNNFGTMVIEDNINLQGLTTLNINGTGAVPNYGAIRGGNNASISSAIGITMQSDSVINVPTGQFLIGSLITGSHSLTEAGSGTLVLNNTNNYTGSTTVSGGTLKNGLSNALPTGTSLTVSNGATYDLNNTNQQVASISGSGTITNNFVASGTSILTVNNGSADSFGGLLTNSGTAALALTKSGTGTLTLTGVNTYSGATTINAGTLQVGVNSAIPSTSAVSLANVSTAIFDLNNFNTTIASLAGGGTTGGNVTLGTGTLTTGNSSNTTYAGVISGSGNLVKQGSGTFTLSNANNYTGSTTISSGTIAEGTNNAIPIGTALSDSGTLDLNGFSQQVASVTGSGTVTNSSGTAGTFTVNNSASDTFAGLISGNLALTKTNSGTLTLSHANTYSGNSTISSGTIADGTNNALPTGTTLSDSGTLDLSGFSQQIASISGSGTVTNSSGTAGTFTINNSSSDSFGGLITGNLALTKSSSGTLTLSHANTYTGATTISAGTVANGINNALPIGTALSASGTLDLNNFSQQVASITGSGTVTNSGATAGTFTINNSGSDSFAGLISGNLALTKLNSGTLTLSGASTYTGTTTISAGTIANGINNALPIGTTLSDSGTLDLNNFSQQVASISGSGTVTNSGATTGTFTINNSGSDSFAGLISGNLALTKSNSGTLTLSSANTYTGATTISAGTVANGINNALPIGTALSDSSTLDLNNFSQQVGSVTGSGTVTNSGATAGTFTINNSGSDSFAGLISGNLALTKSNSGTLTLSSANTYTGATTISAGTMANGINNALPIGTALSDSGTLDLNNFSQQVASITGSGTVTNSGATAGTFTINNSGSDSFAGVISGNLALTKINSGTLTLSGASTYTGATTISAGTVANGINNALPIGTALSDSSTLDLNNFSQQVGSITGSGTVTNSGATSGTFTINNSGSDSFAGLISGNLALTKSNSGTLTLSSANTYTGATTISAGTLANGINNALPIGTALSDSGTLDLNNFSQQVASVTGSGTVTNSGATAGTFTINNSGSDSFAGVISGNLALTKINSGTLTLSGASTYTGATTISAGTVANGINNALPIGTALSDSSTLDLNNFSQQVGSISGSGTVTNSGATAGTFTINNSGSDSFAGLISGNLALTKSNSGTLTLSSASTYTGATTISAGTLANGINNALPIGTALSDSGTLDLNNFSQQVASVTGSGTVTNSGATAGTLTINNSGSDSFAGLISGNLALTKSNNGTLTLSGASTYTGTTTISAGTLANGINNALPIGTDLSDSGTLDLNNFSQQVGSISGSGTVTNSGATAGTFTINNSGSDSFAGLISGNLALTKSNSGTLTLSSASTYTGATTISAGTIANGINNALPIGTALSDSGTLDLNNFSQQVGSISGSGTVTNSGATAGTFTINNNTSDTFAGVINGNLALTKSSNGLLTLSNANTYSGITTISGGTLSAANIDALSTTTISLSSGATLDLNFNNGTFGNSNTLTLNGTGFGGNGALTISGSNDVLNNAITLGSPSAIGGVGSGTLNGIISGSGFSLTKLGTGTITLAGANTFSGGTNINAGILAAQNDNALGNAATTVNSGGTLQINNGVNISNSLTLNGNGASGTQGALVSNGSNATVSSPITLASDSSIGTMSNTDIMIINTTIDGAHALTLQGPGNVTFNDAVGHSTPLTTLTSNTNITIDGGSITTSGIQAYHDPVTLSSNTTFNSSNSVVNFASTIDRDISSASNLTINTGSGDITLSGNVGSGVNGAIGDIALNSTGVTALGGSINAASLTTDAGGTTTLNGTSVNTSGNQTYHDAVSLGSTNNLSSSAGSIYFDASINGNEDLTLNANNGVTFNGIVGGSTPLASLDVTGATAINTTHITTSGSQSYHSGVTLGANITLDTTNSPVNFASTIDRDASAARNLVINTGSGDITISGNVGKGVNGAMGDMTLNSSGTTSINGTVNAASLTTDAGGVTALNGGVVTTSGNQTYNDPITLGAADDLSSSAGSINFANTINGNNPLTVNGNSGVTFSGTVGNTTPVSSLDVSGPTTINTSAITTSGNQTYHDTVAMGSDATLSVNGAGNSTITFDNGINGDKNLTLNGEASSNNFVINGTTYLNNILVSTADASTNNGLSLLNSSNQNWSITNADTGNIAGVTGVLGTFDFSHIQNLTGGSGDNQFSLNGGTLSGAINGGSGNHNTLTADNVANTWTVTGSNSGSVTGVSGGFSHVQNLAGGASNDEFYLAGGSVSGNINGGGGNNTLTADNVNNNWTINGTNSGTVTGVNGTFSDIQNVNGGNSGNTFVFADNAKLTGVLNGGSLAQTNTLNYLDYSQPIKIILVGDITTGNSITTSQSNIATFLNINNLVGRMNNNNILQLPNIKPIVVVQTGPEQGYINDPTYYSGFTLINSNGSIFIDPATVDSNSNIAAILQQGNVSQVIVASWDSSDVSQNIDLLTQEFSSLYSIDQLYNSTMPCIVAEGGGFDVIGRCHKNEF